MSIVTDYRDIRRRMLGELKARPVKPVLDASGTDDACCATCWGSGWVQTMIGQLECFHCGNPERKPRP